MDLYNLTTNIKNISSNYKCRIIGYLHLECNEYFIKCCNFPQYGLKVIMDYQCEIPLVADPLPVIIFGEICTIYSMVDSAEKYFSKLQVDSINNEFQEKSDRVLKAKIIQPLEPSMLKPLIDITSVINNLYLNK